MKQKNKQLNQDQKLELLRTVPPFMLTHTHTLANTLCCGMV